MQNDLGGRIGSRMDLELIEVIAGPSGGYLKGCIELCKCSSDWKGERPGDSRIVDF